MKHLIIFYLIFLSIGSLYAQVTDSISVAKPLRFSVEEDMLGLPLKVKEDIRVYSANKKLEKKEDAVWKVDIITKEQIQNAGVTCVAEALRLLPNILVRQKGNGHYDVRMRGLTLVQQDGFLQELNENTLLLLLDNMPLNQSFNGEIFWEAIPVGIYDIEKIEVLTAPLGTLYGQNALTGIIQIFSRQSREDGIRLQANVQGSNSNDYIHNVAIQYRKNEKLSLRLAGNYVTNRRFEDTYYVLPLAKWTESDSLLFYQANASQTNLYTTLANNNYNVNANIHYQPSEQSYIQANAAFQNTFSQDVNVEVGAFAQTVKQLNQSYVNLHGKLKNLLFQANYQIGKQNLALGYNGYNFNTSQINANMEYVFSKKNFSITPSIYLGNADYSEIINENNDVNYTKSLSEKANFTNAGVALRSEIVIAEKWKLAGAIRNDFLNIPSLSMLNFHLATSLKIGKKNSIKLGYATAYKAPTVYHYMFAPRQQINKLEIPINISQRVYEPTLLLNPMRTSSAEFSWLLQYSDKIEWSTQLFYTSFAQIISPSREVMGNEETVRFANENSNINQIGANVWLKTSLKKFQITMFATWQQTNVAAIPTIASGAPNLFGGFVINYNSLLNKLNLNVSCYSIQSYETSAKQGEENIKGTLFVSNAKLTYRFWKEQSLFLSIRNLKPSPAREFILGEQILPIYLIGVSFLY
ncbi:MAG: hypothetical protein EAZ08_06740 [Cytophagales bacterium]|nr:MAG: hypothetical protein EAZ08_06740 [Cytophagales bacterium]